MQNNKNFICQTSIKFSLNLRFMQTTENWQKINNHVVGHVLAYYFTELYILSTYGLYFTHWVAFEFEVKYISSSVKKNMKAVFKYKTCEQ